MSDTPRKAGRPPLNGVSKLTSAERQKRWREGQAKKQTTKQLGQKIQISITIDEETLRRLDSCASSHLQCTRSEAIRFLLNARMDQIDMALPVMQSVTAVTSTQLFAQYASTIETRHLAMLHSKRCHHEIAVACREELQQFQSAIREGLGSLQDADTTSAATALADQINKIQEKIDDNF